MAYSVVAALLLVLLGYADRIDPVAHPMIATLTLAYPFAIVLNLLAFVAWLFVKPSRSLLPIAAFVMAYGPVRSYCPMNPMRQTEGGEFKVVSLNVESWTKWKPDSSGCFIAHYLAEQQADVVCLQEASTDNAKMETIDSIMLAAYPYKDTAYVRQKGNMQMLYSKHPIARHENIPYESKNNHSTAFYILCGGDTVLIVNNHFESNCLIPADRAAFDSIVSGEVGTGEARQQARGLLGKVAAAASIRAPQAVAVAEYVDSHAAMPIILCGDFNDGPNSFAHYQMAKRLTDCYAEAGLGPGTSYHESHFYFRIDHIFCSKHFTPARAEVDKNGSLSDHYPVIAWLKRYAKD